MALINCMKRFPFVPTEKGENPLSRADREVLLEAASTYERRGMSRKDAEIKAVQDMIDYLEGEREDIEARVLESFKKSPAAKKTAQNKPSVQGTQSAPPVAKAAPLARPVAESQIPAGRVEPKAEVKVLPKDEKPAESPADAWHRVMEGVPGVPRFGELPEYVQKEWTALGPVDRTRAEAVELAQKPAEEVIKRSEQRQQVKKAERVESVRRELRAMMGPLNPAKIQVVQDVSEIPRAVREAVEKTGPLDDTQGFVHDGKAWMIANNIDEGKAFGVFLHEVGAHIGAEGRLEKHQHAQLVDTVKEWAQRNDGSLESKIAQAAIARVMDSSQNTEGNSDNETLAYAIEEAVNSGVNPTLDYKTELGRWLSRVWLLIKGTLDKLGWHVKQKPTAQDLVNLAYGLARMEMVNRDQQREGTQRSFIGKDSTTAREPENTANAIVARMMDSQGASKETVWAATGWYKAPDGKWRMEISDDKAQSLLTPSNGVPSKTVPLDTMLHHPRLFKAYPEAKNIPVSVNPELNAGAAFDPSDRSIHLSPGVYDALRSGMPANQRHALSMLMHEVQHWIQEKEGWADGGSPYDLSLVTHENMEKLFDEMGRISELKNNKLAHPLQERIREGGPEKYADAYNWLSDIPNKVISPTQEEFEKEIDESPRKRDLMEVMYRLLQGEIEAYDTQARIGWDQSMRAANAPGGPIPDSHRIIIQRSVRASKAIDALPKPVQRPVKNITTTIMDLGKRGVYMAALTNDLMDMARPVLPSVDQYDAAEKARTATRIAHDSVIDEIMQQYPKLPRDERGTGGSSVNIFLQDSTLSGKWGYKFDEGSSFEPDPQMAARFRKFSPQAQKLIRDVFKYGHDVLQQEKEVITQMAQDLYHDDPTKRDAFLARYEKMLSLRSDGPYAPLKRFGDYVAIAKSKALIDAEGMNDQTEIQKLQADANHYHVEFAETLAEAKNIAEALGPRFNPGGGYAVASAREATDSIHNYNGALFPAMQRLRNSLNELGNEKAVKEMQGMLRDMELRLLAETSARKVENPRLGVAGAHKDMMRALATQGKANAYFISTMMHNEAVTNALEAMRQEAKVPKNREAGMRYFNEFLLRHAQSFKYDSPIWQNRVKRLTSFWMLATSPAFFFQQLTQTFVMTAPYLAGPHGIFKTEKHLFRAYRDVFPMIRNAGISDRPDFNKLPADVREMIKTLANHGKIDLGIDIEMGSWVKQGTDPGFANATIGKIDRVTRGLTTAVETLNRTTAAIAAYRMEKSRAMAEGKSERVAHDIATRYAEKTVDVTHGAYDGFNTPRLLSSAFPGARLVTQFRRYQIIQIAMLARLFHNSLKGATKEEKWAARKSLGFVLGHAFLLTGALGTPGAMAVANLAARLFGDDDGEEPETDAAKEERLRKLIDDPDLARLLIRGAPAAMGLDVSQKLGFNNTFSLTPFVQSDPFTKKGFQDNALAMLGPAFSVMSKQVDGVDMMSRGEYYKGLEQMVPNGVGNALKGTRFATSGVTLKNGDVVLPPDEITFIDGVTQALGLPDTTLTERSFDQGVKLHFEQFYTQKSTEIKAAYNRAYKSNDADEMQDAREEWQRLQDSRVNHGFQKEPLSALLRAPMAQTKRELHTEGGIEYRPTNRRFVDELTK